MSFFKIGSLTSDFSVHTGPPKLSIPLSHSTGTTTHYIEPKPPTYVTEYESAYNWPPSTAYHENLSSPISSHRRSETILNVNDIEINSNIAIFKFNNIPNKMIVSAQEIIKYRSKNSLKKMTCRS